MNFVVDLQLANLGSKRFMLQTESKHDAFYLGSATIPAIGSDPRVLLDSKFTNHSAGEAFNIQDGYSFTWGRLWTYLAQWYGVERNPPETNEFAKGSQLRFFGTVDSYQSYSRSPN
jgi:hypothetical protein